MKKSSEKPRALIRKMSELLSSISVFKQHLTHPYSRHGFSIFLITFTWLGLLRIRYQVIAGSGATGQRSIPTSKPKAAANLIPDKPVINMFRIA